MKIKTLLLAIAFIAIYPNINGQNYLRIANPDAWNPNTSSPGWENYSPHGLFTDLDLVISPQGVYTEVEVYATISSMPGDTWWPISEILWQFDLPAKTIVHDSWLWVEDEIIKADIIDYWTAFTTYEDIVDRNQDPSFLYILPDNRYEIRIYPMFEGESRRIKMSFLVPATWSRTQVTQDILLSMFQSTDHPPASVSVAVAVDEQWGVPRLNMDGTETTLTEIVVGGTGDQLHYLELDNIDFYNASELSINWDTPLAEDQDAFVSTYENQGEKFYQLAYLPDWGAVYDNEEAEKIMFLLDYTSMKTTTSLSEFLNAFQQQLSIYLSDEDLLNVAVATTEGVVFLDDLTWTSENSTLDSRIEELLTEMDTSNLQLLLQESLNWAQTQGDATQFYLLAASDAYAVPAAANATMLLLQPTIAAIGVPISVLDYQDLNVSVIYHEDEIYYGNSYFYQVLTAAFETSTVLVLRDQEISLTQGLSNMLNPVYFENAIVDYTVSLENGLCYERFNLSSNNYSLANGGALIQTGKYLGELPMEINGYLVSENSGEFYSQSTQVGADQVIPGDTLMREMWYAQHFREVFNQLSSDAERAYLIEQSIAERILTPLTAFLALEPGLGGEPCIACLVNNGGPIIFNTEEFDFEEATISVSPNPTVDFARIRLNHPSGFRADDWQAVIYDATGRAISVLPTPQQQDLFTEWTWELEGGIKAGIYFCTISSEYGEVVTKIVVLR
ncbi:MAG: T9SS type A sorting domain-containing protein [Lewinella sp.]|uniref:T9SS type A sorting domain-containing protein n=1 Tax=Lewinella sp. TaxID=2004506 RepID=UPI003D6B1461